MEKVSALKQRIDESKGKTLNEISRIVDDINAVRACVGGRAGRGQAPQPRLPYQLPSSRMPPLPSPLPLPCCSWCSSAAPS